MNSVIVYFSKFDHTQRIAEEMAQALGASSGPARLINSEELSAVDFEGAVTVDDAIAVCRRTGLKEWALVAHAQKLVYRKFTIYSTRNLWDSPARAFARGMGYCTQYNLALKQILDGLGFETRAVLSFKVRVLDDDHWTMGHTWLRVTIDGEERDVCAGRLHNTPGRNRFVPLWPVLPGPKSLLFLTHLGLILFCGFVEWKAALTGRPAPYWTCIER